MLASPRLFASLAALSLVAFALAACESGHSLHLTPNEPPTVSLTSGPVDTVSAPQSWLVDIAWTASDPDGHIDHVEYAIDPPHLKQAMLANAETTWVQTHENHVVARFSASHPDAKGPGATASQFHVFVLRAVDDRGDVSANVVRAFYAYTVAPDVNITRPAPSKFLIASVPLPFRVDWEGTDPDGDGTRQPAFYRTQLVRGTYELDTYLIDPDSLLREGEATGWHDWDVVHGDTTSLTIPNVTVLPGQSALVAVVAVDAAGATTPYLMLDRNLLRFEAALLDGTDGPRIHIFAPLVDFTYPSGGYFIDQLHEIPVSAAAGQSLEFHWDATASAGRTVTASRWMIDGDPLDDTPRSDPSDLVHWSEPGPPAGSVRFTIDDRPEHRLFIEERDDFGIKSLGIVHVHTVTSTPTRDLLVVDDTRLEVDKFVNDRTRHSPDVYTQPWPSATELDTFLFARGGVPWRGTRNPTSGVLSLPGLFAGYAFDTLGTRLGLAEPALAVRLTTLAQYRHVLWLTDYRGGAFAETSDPALFPLTVLRAISRPGFASTLSAYVQMGGQVWLAGGGAAYASLESFDRRANNVLEVDVFTVRDGELGPGRVMYDAAHVQSALGTTQADFDPERSAVGGWSGHGPDGTLLAPDYARAPASLRFRDPSLDPLPPTRLEAQAALFYRAYGGVSFVLEPNAITEDMDPDPGSVRLESTLDTVYAASSDEFPVPEAPVMLYYHGRENAPFVFTGFDPWLWTRADCQGLVDFVLGDIWKLPKSALGPGARPAGSPARVQRPATSRLSQTVGARRMRP